jgi:hypothetical protein
MVAKMKVASSPISAPRTSRSRAGYVAAAVATIALGLLVHLRGAMLWPAVRDVMGDALWAAMIAWWVGALVPRAPLLQRCAAAYAICAVVEVSQMYHAPWLDALRATVLGQLVLGSGFDARDLAAYALGVGAAALIEMTVVSSGARRQQTG